MSDSVIEVNKKCYPHALLEESKYETKNNKMEILINDDFDSDSLMNLIVNLIVSLIVSLIMNNLLMNLKIKNCILITILILYVLHYLAFIYAILHYLNIMDLIAHE